MSIYEFILNDMTFSFSNLTLFEQCPYAWYLKYIEDRPKCGNCYAEFGTYCHEILEMYANEEIKKDDLLEYYAEYFDEKVPLMAQSKSYDKYYTAGAAYFKNCNLDLNQYEVLGVEKEVKFEIDGHKFIGYIDLLLKGGDDIIVLDHKSAEYPYGKNGKVKKSAEKKLMDYKRQLYLYSKAIYEEYGIYPTKLVWNYFRSKQFGKEDFKLDEYDNTIKWADYVIKKIYATDNFNSNQEYFYCRNLCDYRDGECEVRE